MFSRPGAEQAVARDRQNGEDYVGPIRRLLIGLMILCLFGIFLIWRIDSPRVERFRAAVVDSIVPNLDWAMAPVTGLANLVTDFQSYQRIYEQNQDLRRELQQMRAWREAALQLEQENAKLLDLNNVRLDPNRRISPGWSWPTAALRFVNLCC